MFKRKHLAFQQLIRDDLSKITLDGNIEYPDEWIIYRHLMNEPQPMMP